MLENPENVALGGSEARERTRICRRRKIEKYFSRGQKVRLALVK
jgi:hypothetical protein